MARSELFWDPSEESEETEIESFIDLAQTLADKESKIELTGPTAFASRWDSWGRIGGGWQDGGEGWTKPFIEDCLGDRSFGDFDQGKCETNALQ